MGIESFKKNIYLSLVLVFSSLIVWPLFLPGYFSHHDDLQVMRIFEMRRCYQDLQIPCRWVPDMGYGNGYPLFNYYNPLPYYIGGLLSFVFGYILSAKILFLLVALLGGITMYFFIKEVFDEQAAFVAAFLYQFAPYKALDLYVRGALAESLAIAIIPLCFLFTYKLIKEKSIKYTVGLSLSLAALLMSHNIMAIIFIPVLLGISVFWIISEKSKNISQLMFSFLLGFGLSAFYILPAYFEKNLVQIENLTRLDLDFRAHFATINQLFFDRFWGYGASSPGSDDTISFQIGWPHWWIVIASLIFTLIYIKKKNSKLAVLIILLFIFSILMTHIRSAFIWEKIEILKYSQFPWRFLAVSVFAGSLLGGYLVSMTQTRYKLYIIILLGALTIFLNWQYFRPEKFYFNVGDREKLSGVEWEKQQKAAILDYLPKGAIQPRERAPDSPVVISGKSEILDFENKSKTWKFNIKVLEESTIEVPIFDFPDWQITTNDIETPHFKGTIGRIAFNLSRGEYLVEGKLENTMIRSIANWSTLISFIILVIITIYGKSRKVFR